ncbi:unnamed protein product [Spodoptera exigua]|nr:unnamed protein product [Spodoptera exigua]
MSEDIVQPIVDNNDVTELITTLATPVTDPPLNESDAFPTPSDSEDASNNSAIFGAESLVYNNYSIFGTFVVIELVMTTLELIISIVAAIKMERIRRYSLIPTQVSVGKSAGLPNDKNRRLNTS